jgi:putative transposase
MQLTTELASQIGLSAACRVMGVPRSSLYRARQPKAAAAPRPTPVQALSQEEKATVRQVLNSERFQDAAPRQVYATLLDEQVYLCHWRTMYRILKEHAEVQERRHPRRHPTYPKPELVATGPNQLWSWDITKLHGPAKWVYYYLYVILDVFSRYIVGWLIAEVESAQLAQQLITESCTKQGIVKHQLTLHSDRGSPMKAKTVNQLLTDLAITKSLSRPHLPDDNPYSEAQFKTLKYHPTFPDQFASLVEARTWARAFFSWYNNDFYHTSLALLTPASVHYGQTDLILSQRQQLLQTAYRAHPERFVHGQPQVAQLPTEVWINQPQPTTLLLPNPPANQFILETVSPACPASTLSQPGAQTGSRVAAGQAPAPLDAGEHPAILGPTLGTGGLKNLIYLH